MNALDLPEKPFLKELLSKRMTLKLSQVGHAQSLWQTIKKDRELGSSTWAYVHSLDQAKDYLRKKSLKNPGPEMTYFLFSKKDELMGSVHLHTFSYADHRVEIGYWVSRVYEGKGFASEAVQALEKEVTRLGFHRIEIRCQPRNTRSVNLAKRNHYVLEGTLRQDTRVEGGFLDTAVYGKIIGTDEACEIG